MNATTGGETQIQKAGISDEEAERFRYSAFISYNHLDKRSAKWLHHALETYSIPTSLRGRQTRLGILGAKLPPVFMDREELASSSDLAASVVAALEQSATLIVICSPNGAQSRWVNQEIQEFRRLGGEEHIHCAIVGGEPGASSKSGMDPASEALPAALLEESRSEPLAVDLRAGGDGKQNAKLKLIAGILGVGFDELRRREAARRQRRLLAISAASSIGLVLTSGLAVFAFLSRADAIEQRDLARQKTMTAERTVTFVKSLFEVADPAESRGEEITAREILDRGAARLATELKTEPAVKAELMTTLAEVYLSLGLYKEADSTIRRSLTLAQTDPNAKARQYAVLAASDTLQGHYEPAIAGYSRALDLVSNRGAAAGDLISKLLIGRGEAYSAMEEYEEAEQDIRKAVELDVERVGADHPDIARDLEALGLNYFFSGQLEKARIAFERALRLRRSLQGKSHPKVAQNLNELGNIAYMQGDRSSAARYYKEVIKHDEAVLGPNHPDVAATLNNLARVLLEQRHFVEALPNLRRALSINLSQRDVTHDDLAFIYANLALAERGVGNRKRSEEAFLTALKPAREHKHRNLAPVLTDLADLYCASGRYQEALPLLAEARPVMAADYPDDAWRTAWVDNVKGRCLLGMGKTTEGTRLQKSSLPALQKKWGPDTYYGREAVSI
ncbi:tetratricopeptide repeat protein [Sphingopyxis sp.]|uniref:tetratricopeptide repeat protein n=1 Tax=Sphingopyxis sp. TaxID=1908224 RepID=UPI003BAC2585